MEHKKITVSPKENITFTAEEYTDGDYSGIRVHLNGEIVAMFESEKNSDKTRLIDYSDLSAEEPIIKEIK